MSSVDADRYLGFQEGVIHRAKSFEEEVTIVESGGRRLIPLISLPQNHNALTTLEFLRIMETN
jgi:hypothetical protein